MLWSSGRTWASHVARSHVRQRLSISTWPSKEAESPSGSLSNLRPSPWQQVSPCLPLRWLCLLMGGAGRWAGLGDKSFKVHSSDYQEMAKEKGWKQGSKIYLAELFIYPFINPAKTISPLLHPLCSHTKEKLCFSWIPRDPAIGV